MRILIAEDDYASRKFLEKILSPYAECELVSDGMGAIDAFVDSLKEKKPFDLICLDIMMPKIDGVNVLKTIRELETKKGILPEKRSKIVIVTALGEAELVHTAFEYGCQAYAPKPIDAKKFIEILKKIGINL